MHWTTDSASKPRFPIVGFLFGLPFAAFGLFAACLVWSTCWTWWQERSYVPAQAQIVSAELRISSGKGKTYNVRAQYRYQFEGRDYTAENTGGGSGSDNIGDFHEDMFEGLDAARRDGTTVTAWIDPAQPHRATLNRELRWGMAAFMMLFAVAFGAVGIACLAGLTGGPIVKGRSVIPDGAIERLMIALALWTNLLTVPLMLTAIAQALEAPSPMHLLALAMFAGSCLITRKALQLYRRRRDLPLPR